MVPGRLAHHLYPVTAQEIDSVGEETQLLGAVSLGHDSGWFLLPGTHSKWVCLAHGQVTPLRTYMTGELFELLRRYGTLAAAASAAPSIWSQDAFLEGVEEAQNNQTGLSHQLFGCRARVVAGDMTPGQTHAYLSGLLIGAEFRDNIRVSADGQSKPSLKAIASPMLVQHYQAAASHLGLSLLVLDERAVYIAAIQALREPR